MKFINYFQGWEFHHLANRAEQFGLSCKEKLSNVGDQLQSGKEISFTTKEEINNSLHKLAKIKNFADICSREDCETCNKLYNLYRLEQLDDGVPLEEIEIDNKQEWELDLELWRWQKECKEKWWNNNSQGIVKVITGAGKTIFALSLISQLKQMDIYRDYGLKIIVVVPNTALLKQWQEEFEEKLNLSKSQIGLYYGGKKDDLANKKVMIYVVNSARGSLSKHLKKAKKNNKFDTFLIADECHKYASPENSKIFSESYTYKLGLSATPERQGDYGFENVLVPNLGQVIYSYGYDEALYDGVISAYRLYRVLIDINSAEQREYEKKKKKTKKMYRGLASKYPDIKTGNTIKILGQLAKEKDDPMINKYTVLLNQRKAIVHEAENRFKAVKWLIDEKISYEDKVLVFHERIKDANRIYDYLIDKGYKAGVYHSKVDGSAKKELDKFRNDETKILVTCKALDEGFDLPKIDTGIIASATASIRQRIQRIGRVLRRSPGKYYSSIYTIYVRGIEDSIFDAFEMKDLKGAAEDIKNFHLEF